MAEKKIKAGRYTVEVSSMEKVFYPKDEITKGEVVEYYERVAEVMLPYMKGRPIAMQRFPDGIGKKGFYHKGVPDYFPDWIRREKIKLRRGGKKEEAVCDNKATLVYLADQGCITPHVWLSKVDKIERPDRMIFDLDPPNDAFGPVRKAALELRSLLEELELSSFVMLTGSRGLHVVVPLIRNEQFKEVRDFSKGVAKVLAGRKPKELTSETRKAKRKGRLFLDYLRNAYAQTAVPPYALRPRTEAPVATPIDWGELSKADLHSKSYNIKNIFRRLSQKGDPWKNMDNSISSLKKSRQLLQSMIADRKS
jgi:bifunctional non-homologous end joining protein LigD